MQAKNEILNNRVIQELIEKEQSYNSDLTILFNALEREKDDFDLLDGNWDLLDALHKQIKAFQKISDAFLANIKNATKDNVTESERITYRKKRFVIIKDFLPIYEEYSVSYQQYLNYKKDVESKKIIDGFKHIKERLVENHKKLDDLLILPVQRGLKYILLIDSALKNDSHLDEEIKKELTLLLEKFRAEFKKINDEFTEKTRGYQWGDGVKYVAKGLRYLVWGSEKQSSEVVVSFENKEGDDEFIEIHKL